MISWTAWIPTAPAAEIFRTVYGKTLPQVQAASRGVSPATILQTKRVPVELDQEMKRR